MVPALALWLPVLVAAVLVFLASSVIHMALRYHHNDFSTVPAEDAVRDALRPFAIPPGHYVMPRPASPKDMGTPEFQQKMSEGPVAYLTVLPNGPIQMGGRLVQWFVYCLVVGLFVAYLAGLAYGPGTEYMVVFRFVSATAFVAYALAQWQLVIWMDAKVSSMLKTTLDALIYALLTGGTFAWLWPA